MQNRTEVPLQQCCCLRFKLARYPFAHVERSDKSASNWASPVRNVFDDMLKVAWRVQQRAAAAVLLPVFYTTAPSVKQLAAASQLARDALSRAPDR